MTWQSFISYRDGLPAAGRLRHFTPFHPALAQSQTSRIAPWGAFSINVRGQPQTINPAQYPGYINPGTSSGSGQTQDIYITRRLWCVNGAH